VWGNGSSQSTSTEHALTAGAVVHRGEVGSVKRGAWGCPGWSSRRQKRHYRVKFARFFNRDMVIVRRRGNRVGLDGCVCEKARALTWHRRRGISRRRSATVARCGRQLVEEGKMQFLQGHAVARKGDGDKLPGARA